LDNSNLLDYPCEEFRQIKYYLEYLKKGGNMSKNLGEVINHIMEENSTKRVLILTNHLQIVGTIHDYHNECENCHECLVALKDVKIARIEDVCDCGHSECECDMEMFTEYKWFNISTHAIVGFTILGGC
jgi:hypothetical protein